VFVGSYTPDGLAVADVDATGALTVTATVPGVADVSWLATWGRFLYAANEHDGGSVTVVDTETLAVLGVQSVEGDAPTHLSVHRDGWLLVANYGSGSVTVLPLRADGTLGPPTDVVRYAPGSHAHQILTDPSGRWVLVVDLGTDSVHVYELVAGRLRLRRGIEAGPGPRHLVWHPDGRRAYLVCENAPQVIVCSWDAGTLTPLGTYQIADDGYPGEGVVSADGGFLYVTNRGPNTVATFALGEFRLVDTTSTGGDWPRHATLGPDGRRLYVANQRSGTLTWLPLDPARGTPGPVAGTTTMKAVAVVLSG
jgi:6-phosphogluconolactonase (cycloisomerase 2 family)